MRKTEDMEKYKAAVEISLDAIMAADSEGRITLWNPAAERIFGYSSEEMVGRNIEVIMPDEYREAHRKGMERFLSSGEKRVIGRTVELEALRKDGTRFPVELSLSAERLGERWMFIGVIRDITMRRGLEKELEQRLVEMERMNRVMVGRELKMEELREEIRRLKSVKGVAEGR